MRPRLPMPFGSPAAIISTKRRGASHLILLLALVCVAVPAWAVDSPPQLLDFEVLTPTFDTSATSADVRFRATITDVAPGVCTSLCDDDGTASQVQLVHSATGQRGSALFVSIGPDLYVATVVLPWMSAGGVWQVESVWLADVAGNREARSTSELASAGFTTTVENLATGDTTAPELTAIQPIPASFDSTSGASTTISLQVFEAGSGLCLEGCFVPGGPSQIRYVHALSGQVRDGLIGPAVSGLEAEIEFLAGSAAGLWQLDSLRLVDFVGNRTTLDAVDLANMGLGPVGLTITSSSADVTPPVLRSAGALPYPIDTTGGGLTAIFEADAEDPASGLCLDVCDDYGTSSQVIYRRDGSDHVRFGRLVTAFSGLFEARVEIPTSASADVWRPDRLMLVDRVGNRTMVPEPAWLEGVVAGLLGTGLLGVARSRRTRCGPA